MPTEVEYVLRAEQRIRDVLDQEHAVVPLELEARISEAGYADSGLNINPHHITTALRNLTQRGDVIRDDPTTTRGGAEIDTIQPGDQRRRATAIARAAARKRLLYGRYRGWAGGTRRHPHGLIGPAGEHAVRTGMLLSGAVQPVHPDAGEVRSLLGVDLPGPLDSAAYSVPVIGGLLGPPIAVMVEVKNIRGWVYPRSTEVYQLLHKACVLQAARPTQPVLPVFACRKAHETTFWMAQQLGFMVIELGLQFAGEVESDHLDQVRNELAFGDLRVGNGPSLRVRDRFQRTIPIHGTRIAGDWRKTADSPVLVDLIAQLRSNQARGEERSDLMQQLRAVVLAAGHQGF